MFLCCLAVSVELDNQADCFVGIAHLMVFNLAELMTAYLRILFLQDQCIRISAAEAWYGLI